MTKMATKDQKINQGEVDTLYDQLKELTSKLNDELDKLSIKEREERKNSPSTEREIEDEIDTLLIKKAEKAIAESN